MNPRNTSLPLPAFDCRDRAVARRLLLVIGFLIVAVFGASPVARAQCSCGPAYHRERGQDWWIQFDGLVTSTLMSLAQAAANQWNNKNVQIGAHGSISFTSSSSVHIVFDEPLDFATWDDTYSVLHMPQDFVLPSGDPPTNEYIQALFLHEFGHKLGWEQASSAGGCEGASVMSDTTRSSYRTDFTSCDQSTFQSYFPSGSGEDCVLAGGYEPPCQPYDQTDAWGCCFGFSPIVLDVADNGIEFTSPHDGVLFDILNNGIPRLVSWLSSRETYWLVLDRNGNGRIDDGGELFGNATLLSSGRRARDGYEALREYDGNEDQVLDSRDSMFFALRLWDGVAGPEGNARLLPLAEAGIRSIALTVKVTGRRDRWGNMFRYRSKVELESGASRWSYDVFLAAAPR